MWPAVLLTLVSMLAWCRGFTVPTRPLLTFGQHGCKLGTLSKAASGEDRMLCMSQGQPVEAKVKEVWESDTIISPSSVTAFQQCPKMYEYKYIYRIPSKQTPATVKGMIIHDVLARVFDLPPTERGVQKVFQMFKEEWLKHKNSSYADLFASPSEEKAWGLEALELLANFYLVDNPISTEPMWRERRVTAALTKKDGAGDGPEDDSGDDVVTLVDSEGTLRLSPVKVVGVLDRLDKEWNGLRVVDYKTGRQPDLKYNAATNKRIIEEKFFQLKIYAILVHHELGEVPKELKLIYLSSPGSMTYPFNEKKLKQAKKELVGVAQDILTARHLHVFPPKPGRLCDWCQVKALCPAFGFTGGEEEIVAFKQAIKDAAATEVEEKLEELDVSD